MPDAPAVATRAILEAISVARDTTLRSLRMQVRDQLAPIYEGGGGTLAHPTTLVCVVNALLKADIEQKDIAERLSVSRTTVSRWAQKRNIPRAGGYRQWLVEMMLEFLDDLVYGPTSAGMRRSMMQRYSGAGSRANRLSTNT